MEWLEKTVQFPSPLQEIEPFIFRPHRSWRPEACSEASRLRAVQGESAPWILFLYALGTESRVYGCKASALLSFTHLESFTIRAGLPLRALAGQGPYPSIWIPGLLGIKTSVTSLSDPTLLFRCHKGSPKPLLAPLVMRDIYAGEASVPLRLQGYLWSKPKGCTVQQ